MNRFIIKLFFLVAFVFPPNTYAATELNYSFDFAIAKTSLNSQNLEHIDSSKVYQLLAVASASAKNNEKAAFYVDTYLKRTADFSILDNDAFDSVKNTKEFETIVNQYLPKLNILTFVYFYTVVIGFFIVVIICFNNKANLYSKFLIAGFITIHSVFILEFVLHYSNYNFKYPHTYLMASSGALLYGPLLYLYFKTIAQNYRLRTVDLLHFLPTVILIMVLFPFYALPMEEKIKIHLGSSAVYAQSDFLYLVFFPKLVSLIVYGFLISKLYHKQKKTSNSNSDLVIEFWKKGIYRMHVIYVTSYFVYGISMSGLFFTPNAVLYHAQVIAMSSMVLYVSGMAYIQPKVFNLESYINDVAILSAKYQKSSLTETFSLELKEKLMELLVVKKIYKDNYITLERLSEELNTSRHNTSQIINEHFNENFYEFLNDYRINEAKELLASNDNEGMMNINEILYEVGFNNKVSFNNAFKKRTGITPLQFRNNL